MESYASTHPQSVFQRTADLHKAFSEVPWYIFLEHSSFQLVKKFASMVKSQGPALHSHKRNTAPYPDRAQPSFTFSEVISKICFNSIQSNNKVDLTTYFIPLSPILSSTQHPILLWFFALMWRLLPSINGDMNYLKFAVEELAFVNQNHCSFLKETPWNETNACRYPSNSHVSLLLLSYSPQ
jgi:hypothetical protein